MGKEPPSCLSTLQPPGTKGGWEKALPGATFSGKTMSTFHSWLTRKEQTPLYGAWSLRLENPLKNVMGVNVFQLWGKGRREQGEHFPEYFSVLTNKACSSVECLFFHCNFYFQSLLFSLCSNAIFPPGSGGKLLHPWLLFIFNIFHCD